MNVSTGGLREVYKKKKLNSRLVLFTTVLYVLQVPGNSTKNGLLLLGHCTWSTVASESPGRESKGLIRKDKFPSQSVHVSVYIPLRCLIFMEPLLYRGIWALCVLTVRLNYKLTKSHEYSLWSFNTAVQLFSL